MAVLSQDRFHHRRSSIGQGHMCITLTCPLQSEHKVKVIEGPDPPPPPPENVEIYRVDMVHSEA